jgi:hypothetical protein
VLSPRLSLSRVVLASWEGGWCGRALVMQRADWREPGSLNVALAGEGACRSSFWPCGRPRGRVAAAHLAVGVTGPGGGWGRDERVWQEGRWEAPRCVLVLVAYLRRRC